MPIRILDQTLINQIAAGEVIVRPASVIKELVENSLDAGATRITIEVDKECRAIRVTDDGCGMAADQLELAICRHATSKISSLDDLSTIATRGFRGEALASIVAVSRFELTTRPAQSLAGAQLRAEGGAVLGIASIGCPPGTTIDVRDLFFNTPARLKFMKTPASEWGQIQTILTRQALAAPHAGFTVIHAGKKAWEAPPNQGLLDRIAQLFGAPVADKMLEVAQESDAITYRGFIGKPGADRADRRQQFFFINDRPIVSQRLAAVLLDAYKGLIMVQRYPVAVLYVDMPAEEVDVNVHPTKEEVRFENERKVAGLMHRAVVATLRAHNHVPHFAAPASANDPNAPVAVDTTLPLIFQQGKIKVDASWPPEGYVNPRLQSDFLGVPAQGEFHSHQAQTPHPPSIANIGGASDEDDLPDFVQPPNAAANGADESLVHRYLLEGRQPRAIGQVGDSYVLAELGEDLLFIDQHAAHERILYHKFKSSLRHPDIQPLMTPIPFRAAPMDAPGLEEMLPHLQSLGIEIEHFGGHDFFINGLPVDLADVDATGMIQDLLDARDGEKADTPAEMIRDRMITRMACHAAIKAGQHLSPQETNELLSQILTTKLSFTCPHGRPTMILLTKDQLDRQFKRK